MMSAHVRTAVRTGSRLGWLPFFSLVLNGAAALSGCSGQDRPAGTPVEQAWESPPPPVTAVTPLPVADVPPASMPAHDPAESAPPPPEPVAVVNGRAIDRDQFMTMLVEAHGLRLLEQMVLLAAAQQRAESLGLKATDADVRAAHNDALQQMAQPIGAQGAPLDRAVAERLLSEFLVAKNISRGEWDLRMRQRALLRRIAASEVDKMDITEGMLREEYALLYGERVQIRHIQLSSLSAVERVRALLTAGREFEAVAREHSENQITGANGGLVPPFTRNDGAVPPLIREAAFQLQPGELPPALHESTWYHLIKLERRFPASDVTFENADHQALQARLVDRLIRQRQEALEEELFRSAMVDIRNDVLERQFREKYR